MNQIGEVDMSIVNADQTDQVISVENLAESPNENRAELAVGNGVAALSEKFEAPARENNNLTLVEHKAEPATEKHFDPLATERVALFEKCITENRFDPPATEPEELLFENSVNLQGDNEDELLAGYIAALIIKNREESQTENNQNAVAEDHVVTGENHAKPSAKNRAESKVENGVEPLTTERVVLLSKKLEDLPGENNEMPLTENNAVASAEKGLDLSGTEGLALNNIDLPGELETKISRVEHSTKNQDLEPPAPKHQDPVVEKRVDQLSVHHEQRVENHVVSSNENREEPRAATRQEPVIENRVDPSSENHAQRIEIRGEPQDAKSQEAMVENRVDLTREHHDEPISKRSEEPSTKNLVNAPVENVVDAGGENQEKAVLENNSKPLIENRSDPIVENRAEPSTQNVTNPPVNNRTSSPDNNRREQIIRRSVANENDADSDDEPDETIIERIIGLGEMFPPRVQSAAATILDLTWKTTKNVYWFSRNATWYVITTSLVLFGPMVILTERAHMTEMQKNEQKQVLLGPLNAMKATGAAVPPLPPTS